MITPSHKSTLRFVWSSPPTSHCSGLPCIPCLPFRIKQPLTKYQPQSVMTKSNSQCSSQAAQWSFTGCSWVGWPSSNASSTTGTRIPLSMGSKRSSQYTLCLLHGKARWLPITKKPCRRKFTNWACSRSMEFSSKKKMFDFIFFHFQSIILQIPMILQINIDNSLVNNI